MIRSIDKFACRAVDAFAFYAISNDFDNARLAAIFAHCADHVDYDTLSAEGLANSRERVWVLPKYA